ncbi:unnamed protein product [Pleuronectes platessa]|uniref:Secreted protein n=1 Tax=Pleuronectes platessa TaxID=8262 RepID=A0A9N7TNK6_PLEPL|nr:unnamed protein product [Pleuronectes platessa]
MMFFLSPDLLLSLCCSSLYLQVRTPPPAFPRSGPASSLATPVPPRFGDRPLSPTPAVAVRTVRSRRLRSLIEEPLKIPGAERAERTRTSCRSHLPPCLCSCSVPARMAYPSNPRPRTAPPWLPSSCPVPSRAPDTQLYSYTATVNCSTY